MSRHPKPLKAGWYVGRIEGPGYPERVQEILDAAGIDRPPPEILVIMEAWHTKRLDEMALHVNGVLVANDWRIKNWVEIAAGPFTDEQVAQALLKYGEAEQAQEDEPGPDNTEATPPGKEQ